MSGEFVEIQPNKTFAEIGLDQFGQNQLDFTGSEVNFKAQTMSQAGVPSNFVQSGMIISSLSIGDTNIKLDGENRQITISDGTNTRILIGRAVGLF